MNELTEWRTSQNLKSREAAEMLSISRTQLFRLESGMRLASPQCAKRISAVTGIPLSVIRPDIFDIPKMPTDHPTAE